MKIFKIIITLLTAIAFTFITVFSARFGTFDFILSVLMTITLFGTCLLFVWEPELNTRS